MKDAAHILKVGIAAITSNSNHMTVLSEYTVDEIFSLNQPFFDFGTTRGKLISSRLNTFKKSQQCISCGIFGTVLRLEHNGNLKDTHFNLYAKDGEEYILMTVDHIVPRAKGGKSTEDNLQTMCIYCNNIKSHYHLKPNEVYDIMRSLKSLIERINSYLRK